MSTQKPIVAMLYDFDKTLSPKNMQEYSFIPNMGMDAATFWAESNKLVKEKHMDTILAYMYLMIKKATATDKPIRRSDFVQLGKNVEYFKGVATWFDRINAIGKENGVTIEHYIISSGLKEIIEGTSIGKYFKEIYACEFYYDHNEIACWPKVAVNYTTKTQFLFRINKGINDQSNDEDVNKFTPKEKRRVPFQNMVYIGDGLTDVPCMKIVKDNGGHSIAVYPPNIKDNRKTGNELMEAQRVDFVTPADYSEDSDLQKIVALIVGKVSNYAKLSTFHTKLGVFEK